MNHSTDYRLDNLRNREMKRRSQRQDIIVSDGQTALNKILDAPSPAALVQSFPDQDLYYLMHKIGPDDFVPVLSMATSDQWEYILDVEIWDGDRFDLDTMTKTLDLLFQADPNRLLRWGIKEKPAFFEYFLSKYMTVKIREHDEPPPADHEDYITIDDKFYFRFPEKPALKEDQMPVPGDHRPAWELIEKMVKMVAEMDLSVFHGLLLETVNLLPAEVEEEEFRLKSLRLAEKGFLPAHEAIGIYQPVTRDGLRSRPEKKPAIAPLDPDIPLPPQFFTGRLDIDDLFVAALQNVAPDFLMELESELASLINKVISADKIKLKSRADFEKAVAKTHSYLNLGLEMLLKDDVSTGPAVRMLSHYFLEDIFRFASSACIQLKTRAVKWFNASFMAKNRLPLSFLDETYLGIIGGLFVDRPVFFDNYETGELYRDFHTADDLLNTRIALDEVIALDAVLGRLDVDVASFEQGVLTYKTLLLTLWCRNRLGLPSTLAPIEIGTFKSFFKALFTPADETQPLDIQLNDLTMWICETSGTAPDAVPAPLTRVIESLISELDQEYGLVDTGDLDPRFIPHFLLTR